MRTESLLNELRQLKQSKPVVQLPRSQKRKQRYMMFEEQNGFNLLNKEKEKRKHHKRQGIFQNITFCFPLIDPEHDPCPSILAQLAKGIVSQGGRIVQYRNDLVNKSCQYILVDERSDIGWIRGKLKGKLVYLSIIDYKWVECSLKKLSKLSIAPFNLQNKYTRKYQQKKMQIHQIQQKDPQQTKIIEKSSENNYDTEGISVIINECNPCQKDLKQFGPTQIKQEQNIDSSCGTEIMQQQQPIKQCQIKQQMQKKQQNSQNSFNSQPYISQDQFQKYYNHNQQQDIRENEIKLSDQINGKESQLNIAQYNQDEEDVLTEKVESEDERDPAQKKEEEKRAYYRITKKIQNKQQTPKQTECIKQLKGQTQTRKKTKLTIGSHQFSVNNGIVQMLKKMQQHYQTIGDRKSYAYLRAIACIKNYGKSITDADQLRDIEGIGKQMREKVRQFLKTGSIKKIDQKVNKQNSVPHKQLLRVFGIGPTTAEQLYHRGIRTIQDLQKNKNILNKNQQLGLRYLNDFEKRIPREKVAKMLQFVKQTLFYIVRSDSHHQIQAVGSFRRGKATCGDMDILITRRDGYVQKSLLQHLVTELEKRKFITDHITFPKNYDGHSSVNYMGVCRMEDQTHHRIDLKHYPVQQYAFALLYFTGSDLFNRQMRMHAHEKGLMLSDHSVKKKERNGQGKIWRGGKIPICYTEKDIFSLLEMQFRAPAQREL